MAKLVSISVPVDFARIHPAAERIRSSSFSSCAAPALPQSAASSSRSTSSSVVLSLKQSDEQKDKKNAMPWPEYEPDGELSDDDNESCDRCCLYRFGDKLYVVPKEVKDVSHAQHDMKWCAACVEKHLAEKPVRGGGARAAASRPDHALMVAPNPAGLWALPTMMVPNPAGLWALPTMMVPRSVMMKGSSCKKRKTADATESSRLKAEKTTLTGLDARPHESASKTESSASFASEDQPLATVPVRTR